MVQLTICKTKKKFQQNNPFKQGFFLLPEFLTLSELNSKTLKDLAKLLRLYFGLTLALVILASGVKAQRLDSIGIVIDRLVKEKAGKPGKSIPNPASYRADTIKISKYLSMARSFQSVNYDSLLFYSQKALRLSLKITDLPCISRSIQLLGRYYIMKENYRDAGKCFLKSIMIEEKLSNPARIADLNDELGGIYFYQELFNKALPYFTVALEVYEKNHDTLDMAKVLSHLGNLHASREYCEHRTTPQKKVDYTTAIQYFEKSIQLCKAIGYKPLIINSYVNIAAVYNKFDKPEKALPYLQRATDYFRSNKKLNDLSGALQTLGITYYKLKNYNKSIESFKESLKIGIDNNFIDGIQYLYESMAQTYDGAKDYKNARDYYVKYMTVKDSVANFEKSKELFEVETKYQTEKKENEIIKLTAEKREKNLLLLALSGLILMLAISGYFFVKNIRNKKLIAEQTLEIKDQYIQDLEKERQLVATKSVLKGEESERSRMARDLHDGLGGLLSGVKINLSSMKGNSIITSENAQAFDHAIKLLDTSISELRRVAHNLMPETLNHYGLKTALNDFIGEMTKNPSTELTFSFFGADIRFESQLELTAFRIAQELVNNSLKHSGATKIDLQLIADIDRICIQVVDNGKGFDTKGRSGDGKGLVSIRDRITANNGRFEIESAPGEGTEATVEFLLS
jgi:two-component system NarL family sensor kinase